MLAPHISTGRLLVLLHHAPVAVKRSSPDLLSGVVVQDLRTETSSELSGQYVVDATELGELLELGEVEHVCGQESQADTHEPSAPAVACPMNVQAFSWCFAIEHIAGADHVGAPPDNYAYWAKYRFPITPPWPGPLLSLGGMNPRTLEPVQYRFEPNPAPASPATPGRQPPIDRTLWTYRRIIDRHKFVPGSHASDVVVVNWPMNDYLTKSLIGGSAETRAAAKAESRQLSLALLHWLQTEAPRPDGGKGWPGLRTRPDVTGTSDGLAKMPYIRESRRIKALLTIREQDVAAAALPKSADRAREFEDSVGIGSYRIDLHPSHGGDNFVDVATLPFQIPLRALVPVRVQNLLPAAKNIGTTHITNGCYRLHPVEWNIGEAAGALAGFCLRHSLRPQQVAQTPLWQQRFQQSLYERGVETAWPSPLIMAEGDPHVHAG